MFVLWDFNIQYFLEQPLEEEQDLELVVRQEECKVLSKGRV